jgi:hypothetical protein
MVFTALMAALVYRYGHEVLVFSLILPLIISFCFFLLAMQLSRKAGV